MRCEHCNRYARRLTPQLLPGGFGLVMKDACADRSCDDTPHGIQTRATALARRQQAIKAHHDREEVRGWVEKHARRMEREQPCPGDFHFVDPETGEEVESPFGEFQVSWTPMPPVHIMLDGKIHTIDGKSATLTLPDDYRPTFPALSAPMTREGEEVEEECYIASPNYIGWPE
jgi:hypothetical protein